MSWALGLGGSDHDFSAALMHGTDIRVAIEEERLSRKKHGIAWWFQNPAEHSVKYCLGSEGIELTDLECLVSSDLLPYKVRGEFAGLPLRLYPHHLCHAASTYMLLPPGARAAILVYDGMGSVRSHTEGELPRNIRETFSFFLASQDGITCLGETLGAGLFEHDNFPTSVNNSIGMLYELVTALLGFDILDAGKTMGLSAHGRARFLPVLEKFTRLKDDYSSCFLCQIDDAALRVALRNIIEIEGNSFAVRADLAASIQTLINNTLLHCASLFAGHRFDYLCVAGGCALNTVANSFMVENSTFDVPVLIPPYANDAGLAFGALWLYARERLNRTDLTFRGKECYPHLARPGRLYSDKECTAAANRFYPDLFLDQSIQCPDDLAAVLESGQIVGMLNGRSEIGPRALGGRSIVADPRRADTREAINRKIKGREPFRPLAPMILSEHYGDYFEDARQMDPFMLKVSRATPRCRHEAPAIVHVDGTARVQVVNARSEPFLAELLNAFHKRAGLPLLLNTSFNRRGEPIVESPEDAVDAFLGMGLDGLYLGGQFYRPARPSASRIP